jgi:hypothetical protein
MTIVREGKELWIFNCARLDERTEASLEEMGKVTHVVSMSSHKHHDAYFQERFDAKLWTIEGLACDIIQNELREDPFPARTRR